MAGSHCSHLFVLFSRMASSYITEQEGSCKPYILYTFPFRKALTEAEIKFLI
jgi:hypothetical protein